MLKMMRVVWEWSVFFKKKNCNGWKLENGIGALRGCEWRGRRIREGEWRQVSLNAQYIPFNENRQIVIHSLCKQEDHRYILWRLKETWNWWNGYTHTHTSYVLVYVLCVMGSRWHKYGKINPFFYCHIIYNFWWFWVCGKRDKIWSPFFLLMGSNDRTKLKLWVHQNFPNQMIKC